MRLAILLTSLLFTLSSNANDLKLVKSFFETNGIQNKSEVYIGEMLEHHINRPTLGKNIPANVNRTYRVLEKDKKRAIYAVLLTQGKQSQDWYAYLKKDKGTWKLSAIRNLALPGLFFMALQQAEEKATRNNKEEQNYQNMLLTIKTDSELKQYLNDNLKQLTEIVKLASSDIDLAKEKAESIFLNHVSKSNDLININIGGMLDNSVGYLFAPNNKDVPSMSDSEYIYIEHVIGNWYIYKTT